MTEITPEQEAALGRAVARLRAGVLAIVFGLVAGATLWVATVWLVLRGGRNVGEHLGLLRFYFPGYTVTWLGAFVGFAYAALAGAVTGFLVAWIYNRVADRRAR